MEQLLLHTAHHVGDRTFRRLSRVPVYDNLLPILENRCLLADTEWVGFWAGWVQRQLGSTRE